MALAQVTCRDSANLYFKDRNFVVPVILWQQQQQNITPLRCLIRAS